MGLSELMTDTLATPAQNILEGYELGKKEAIEEAQQYLTDLTTLMAKTFFADKGGKFEPLPTLIGLCSQIDNMLTGMSRDYKKCPKESLYITVLGENGIAIHEVHSLEEAEEIADGANWQEVSVPELHEFIHTSNKILEGN